MLTVLAFAAGLNEKSSADWAEPALIALQDRVASELDIGSIRIVRADRGRAIITIALPGMLLAVLVGIGTLIYALIR